MPNSVIHKKNIRLYEEPTTYKYDYIHRPMIVEKKISTKTLTSTPINYTKCLDPQQTLASYDTLQYLNYNERVPFNIFWEPKESIGISIKPIIRQQILGDPQYQEVVRSRPRLYMSPGISLDDIKSSETRKLLVNFTYTTTSNYASKTVWRGSQPKHSSHTEIDLNDSNKKSMQQYPSTLSARFPTEAYTWDKSQDRSLSVDDTFAMRDIRSNIKRYNDLQDKIKAEQENNQIEVKSLIEKDKLHTTYDKLPLTYGGYRSYTGLGIPLEKKILPVVHPDLHVSKALYQKRADSSTL